MSRRWFHNIFEISMSKLRLPNRCISNVRFFGTKRRKYPVDPELAQKLPVFQYNISKKGYRRVFTWGNIYTGALGIPYMKSTENIKKQDCLRYPKRVKIGEICEVTTAACGFGFTVFAVKSDTDEKLYGTGINTDSQIGYCAVRQDKPLEILYQPKPIHLSFKNPCESKVIKVSAGRAHTIVLTNEGIFLLGNNAYGQCGRSIIPNEDYIMSNYVNHIEKIDGKNIIDIECGQDHSLALTEDGAVYSCGWGADGQTGLGHYDNWAEFSKVKGDIESEKITELACRSDFALALNEEGQVFGWGNIEYSQMTQESGDQQVATPKHIKMLDQLGKIKSVATAGSFCVVVNDDGQVYSWGYGLLGAGPEAQQSKVPVHIPHTLFGRNHFQADSKVVKVCCGLYNAAAITNFGNLYMWGRNKYGCLGLGNEKDQYFPLRVAIGGYVEKIFCGVDHTVAICKPFI